MITQGVQATFGAIPGHGTHLMTTMEHDAEVVPDCYPLIRKDEPT